MTFRDAGRGWDAVYRPGPGAPAYHGPVTFSDVTAEVHGLYRKGRFADAIAVALDNRDRFPSEDATFTFWEACLLSMNGTPDPALAVLREGLNRGLWWSEATLADSDLDAVRRLDSWEQLLTESATRAEAAALIRPAPRIRAANVHEPKGIVVALHGGQANPAVTADDWEAAVPGDWRVINPVGTVPAMPNRWSWPMGADESIQAVIGQLPGVDRNRPTVLCGFSQGGRVALDLAAGAIRPQGLILIAPAIRAQALPPIPDAPTMLHVGDQDWAIEGVESLAQVMDRRGTPARVERIAGFGHAMPDDLHSVVQRGLDWIASARAPDGSATG